MRARSLGVSVPWGPQSWFSVLVSIASIAIAIIFSASIAVAQSGPRIGIDGVDLNDPFEKLFANAIACGSQHLIEMRRQAGLKNKYRCPSANVFASFLRGLQNEKRAMIIFLQTKGGTCKTDSGQVTRCVVEREVSVNFNFGDHTQGMASRSLMTLIVMIGQDEALDVDFSRYEFAPGERRG